MKLCDIIQETLNVSEKAALIAREIRSKETLFQLLIQEKTGAEKNKRFVQDFKTLADVLVQKVVRHELGQKFAGLSENIRGEESNSFTNAVGETITVEITATETQTAKLLEKVLDNQGEAANLLAEIVHRDVHLEPDFTLQEISEVEIDPENVCIWIDPIDSTSQYIKGCQSLLTDSGIYSCGLQSVCVLIGAFHKTNGNLIYGVINQPFAVQDSATNWTGRRFWGTCLGRNRVSSVQRNPILPHQDHPPHPTIVTSSSETDEILAKLAPNFSCLSASGAGYKIMCVIDNMATAFVLSKASCFKWDTCAPHAILASYSGGILNLQKALDIMREASGKGGDDVALRDRIIGECQLQYHVEDRGDLPTGEQWSNTGGILAYKDPHVVLSILNDLL